MLGWELLGVEYAGDFHSWLSGLLASEHDARAVAGMIASGVGADLSVARLLDLLRQVGFVDSRRLDGSAYQPVLIARRPALS